MKFRAVLLPAAVCALALAMACAGPSAPPSPQAAPPAPAAAPAATPAAAPAAPDLSAVARTMVKNALIKTGDKVAINGSVRDYALLEDLAIETMKAGGQPLIAVGSDTLGRRSYDEVPESYDSLPRTLDLAMVSLFNAQLSVDTGESENALAGVPAARMATRAKAAQPVSAAALKMGVRYVNLGNDLYPTAPLAARLGRPQADIAAIFWKAAMVAPETLRAKGDALRAALAGAKQVTLASANGTKITFGVDLTKAFVSDGAITPEKVKQGRAATMTWLPAGELLVPVAPGTGDGTIVVDKLVFQGELVEALTLTFAKGRLASMTAKSGLGTLKAQYDASAGGKDMFAFIDLGLNPEAALPTNTGRVIWMAPGGVTVGMGDNTSWGGTNQSTFGLACAVTAATLAADGKVIIDNGALK